MTNERVVIESLFEIANKQGQDVPFIFNSAQRRVDSELTYRHLIPKARQEGVSSLMLAKFTLRCLHKRNTRAVVISHDQASTERLFKRVKYFLDHLRGPSPILEYSSKREITFPKTDSMFYIGTAGTRKFGRGDTITDLHCSEVAFWPDPKELFSGLSDAVPLVGGQIVLESTGNGMEFFHGKVMDSVSGKGEYKYTFLPWTDFPEYNLPISEEEAQDILSNLDPTFEEDTLVYEHRLTAGQIKFRRIKLAEKSWDTDLFKQEYPRTIDECFRTTGHSLFRKVNYVETPEWQRLDKNTWALAGHPRPDRHYIVGGDASAGVGGDNAVAQVISIEDMEQVYEFASDNLEPFEFGENLAVLGYHYGGAFITVEANNHGIVTLKSLQQHYPSSLIYKEYGKQGRTISMGFKTTMTSKPLALGDLRTAFIDGLIIHSFPLKSELDVYVEHPDGKLGAMDGYHDDRVMALVMSIVGFKKAALRARPVEVSTEKLPSPYLLETIIKELSERSSKFPISPQALII